MLKEAKSCFHDFSMSSSIVIDRVGSGRGLAVLRGREGGGAGEGCGGGGRGGRFAGGDFMWFTRSERSEVCGTW